MSASGRPDDAEGVGLRLADEMLADGAAQLTEPGPDPAAIDDPMKRQDA
jgi:hydroxymethylbilane synthase